MVEKHVADHTLVRRIADGSYGEVWLVKSAHGSWRAVKIINYRQFKDPRPYEREYNGVKEYEPISREHTNLVDVLHVGKCEEHGVFYYIMELADNFRDSSEKKTPGKSIENGSNGNLDVENYEPYTLEKELQTYGRLPVKKCIQIGVGIASALEFLHNFGLIHRDVKPSNIIRINGIYKLADVGLVASIGSSHSLVGTEGYIPPEGPGTTKADIYALGKVLYEISTGKDRLEFPNLPTLLDHSEENKLLIDLNRIVTKACHPDPSKRYSSMSEMLEELKLLEQGGSVQELRKTKRIKKIASICALWVILGFAAYCGYLYNASGLIKVNTVSQGGVINWWIASFCNSLPDPPLEIVVPVNDSIYVFDSKGNLIHAQPILPKGAKMLRIDYVNDINKDGIVELFVSWVEGTNLTIQVTNHKAYKYKEFHFEGRVSGNEVNLLIPVGLITNKQNNCLFIARVDAAYLKKPRGIACYDYESEKLLWFFPFAPFTPSCVFTDINGDGDIDMILGSGSPCNGSTLEDGTDDCHLYLNAISSDGKLLWRQVVGDEYAICNVELVDFNNNGTNEIIAEIIGHPFYRKLDNKPELGIVQKYSLDGKLIAQYEHNCYISSFIIGDLDGDGKKEIIAADKTGSILILNSQLSPLKNVNVIPPKYTDVIIDNLTICDLDQDGKNELVFLSSHREEISGDNPGYYNKPDNIIKNRDVQIVILDRNLRVIDKYLLWNERFYLSPSKLVIKDFYGNGKHQILVASDKLDVFEFRKSILRDVVKLLPF